MVKKNVELFKALGDETRFKIISSLMDEEKCTCSEKCACMIPRIVKRAQPTVSLQLKYLVEKGVLSYRKEGKKRIYKIKDPRVKKIMKIV